MSPPQQEFTFINVASSKKSNTRVIKRHVSNQTNKRKRQEAVAQYQQSLLQAAEPSSSSSDSSLSPDIWDDKLDSTVLVVRSGRNSPEISDSPVLEKQDDAPSYRHQGLFKPVPIQMEDYWSLYVKWANENLAKVSQPSSPATNIPRRPHKTWRVYSSPFQSRLFVSVSTQHTTTHVPRIDDPSDYARIHRALKTCRDYIHGSYESKWKAKWQDKEWFQGSILPLGIWRECFPLSVELIQVGKLQEAFYILNAALNLTPAFFKEDHPTLLIALIGAMLYTCKISDRRLSNLIKSHVTQLSMAHLGHDHPISMLLTEQLRLGDEAYAQAHLLSAAILDCFSDIFGVDHFMSTSMRFGYVRHQLNNGDFDGALKAIGKLEKVWSPERMPGAQLPKFLAFEKSKVLNAQKKAESIRLRRPDAGTQELSNVADDSIQLPVFIPGKGPALQDVESAILKRLGKHLLFGSHYALALYIFTRIPEVFSQFSEADKLPPTSHNPLTLPKTVARILVEHLKAEMKAETASPAQADKL